ncbi:MAG TPA: TonB-dependent receptor [Usitatibacter sp.]|nr:TonB-dependent receptor [Usitatibacter sp.]
MKMPARRIPAPLAVAVASLFAAQAFAQTAPLTKQQEEDKAKAEKMETIITTGTRTPKAVDKIPGAITVITQEELQHTRTLTEDATAVLARTVPGYAESSQAMSNSGETLRGRTALRLFDGIPQTSPLREGNRSGTFTDMGLVGRIEVINGPSASEGIGASGGIINYISKYPTKMGTEVTVNSRYTTQFHDDSEGWKLGLDFAHKNEMYDVLMATSFIERGMTYDGNGRRIGLNTSGSMADSEAKNLFLKVGANFGPGNAQRLQGTISRFHIIGKGNYILVDGDRNLGLTNTSELGSPLGSKTDFNEFNQGALKYTHDDLFGGQLNVDVYRASQAMRFVAENGDDRQDPLIAPLGQLIDQSEINSQKRGVRASYSRQDLFVRGLELRFGLDVVEDETQQKLALTNRVWVPPMTYKSKAPWAQLSYDIGPATLSAGIRREDGELSVDTYTTTYFRNRVTVQGGTLDYQENLPNYGIVWRLPQNFSVFAAYGKGFSLPNVGIPLRNQNRPGQSVGDILDLQAVVVDNKEVGVNWRGTRGNVSASYYHSKSDFGVALFVDPASNDFVMRRQPVDIKGFEVTGELNVNRDLKVGALYSRIRGKTVFVDAGPLDKEMGVLDINPDKLGTWASYRFNDRLDVRGGSTTLYSRDLNVGKSGEEHTKGYTLFDLAVNYDLKKYGAVSVGIENLTNKFYILSWSQVVGFRNYWAGRGRVFSINHTIKF